MAKATEFEKENGALVLTTRMAELFAGCAGNAGTVELEVFKRNFDVLSHELKRKLLAGVTDSAYTEGMFGEIAANGRALCEERGCPLAWTS